MPRPVRCPDCEGHQTVACETCDGSGRDPRNPSRTCRTCRGNKTMVCSTCRGTGQVSRYR